MEILLRNIPNDYVFKKDYLDSNSDSIETLIFGSSHSFYDLNPVYFDSKTFNASHVSQSLNYDYEILMKYHSHFKNLETIIVPMSYFTLFGKLEAGLDSWRIKNYMIYYELDLLKPIKYYSEVLSNKASVNVKRFFSYYILDKNQISCSKLGWGENHNSKDAKDLVKTGKTASNRHTRGNINSGKYKEIFEENIEILNSLLKWSKERGIKVLLITPPAFKSYVNNLDENQLNKTVKTASKKCNSFGNCKYINFLTDDDFVANDYYDADHLNEIGAEKFSIKINEIVEEW